ncbi:MAG TPA: DUF488 family protein [Rhodanobacteraceae bacterium]|jgi:uncharacterized protein YeaO (DUF488 family)|nr:DUF488 family protein [Rhodanobacteraceae bacterium]
MTIKLKRVYEKASRDDGFRILVDRLWPRGVSKVEAHVDAWLKGSAPSTALRQWFGHDPAKWDEFRRRYTAELKQDTAAVAEVRDLVAEKKNVTFVFSERDTEHTHAIVLKDFVERGLRNRAPAKTTVAAAKSAARKTAANKATKTPRSARPKAAPRRSR